MIDSGRIMPAGDAAVVVEFEQRVDVRINARAMWLAEAVNSAGIPGVRDVVPTYCSVAVYYDPLRTDYGALVGRLEQFLRLNPPESRLVAQTPVRVPVCYGGDLGPDLPAVSSVARMSPEEVVAIHASEIYRVFMLGFAPGFAYMGVVDDRLRMARHETPRVRVPGGSVAIAGQQTAIYPADGPGGWQIIGRTPLQTFDPSRREPSLFKPGDAVQFVPIGRREFDTAVVSG